MNHKAITTAAVLCGLLATTLVITYSRSLDEGLLFGGLVFFLIFVAALVGGERLRRWIEGYYVYMKGGAEDGSLIYNENGRTVQLYFSRIERVVYVPSDAKWQEVMPSWAKARKDFITSRVRKQTGRHWSFKESDKPQYV